MTPVLVDSNVLIDVMNAHDPWSAWSAQALEDAGNSARLIINPIIYAEVSMRFSRIEDLDQALPLTLFDREPISDRAAFLAGKAFLVYRTRGGARHSPLPEFFIGDHAATAGYRLLTRDVARYRTYFPDVDLIVPE